MNDGTKCPMTMNDGPTLYTVANPELAEGGEGVRAI